jgi:hypothetical protein
MAIFTYSWLDEEQVGDGEFLTVEDSMDHLTIRATETVDGVTEDAVVTIGFERALALRNALNTWIDAQTIAELQLLIDENA